MSTGGDAGYVTDVAYPHRFHRETMPLWLHATATALGRAAPDVRAPFTWCELGCGQGLGTLLAAATYPQATCIGVDLAPEPIAAAQAIADVAGLRNARFVAGDFRALVDAADTTLPPCDFIVVHGVWSWIAEDAQRAALDLIGHRLQPGGLLYLAYMTHPGASPLASIQRLMREHARHSEGDSATRAAAAMALLQRLSDPAAGAGAFNEHPALRHQIAAMAQEDPAYLAHEFLSAHWQPLHAADVIDAVTDKGLTYVGSATPIENVDTLSIPGGVQSLLARLPAGPLAETVKDIARNQSLRRDLYQNGGAPLSAADHLAALDRIELAALPGAPSSGGLRVDTRIGPIDGPAALFGPVLAALASGPHTFATLRRLAPFADAPGLLNQVVQVLIDAGCAHVRQDGVDSAPAVALNRLLAERGTRHWRAVAELGTALVTRD